MCGLLRKMDYNNIYKYMLLKENMKQKGIPFIWNETFSESVESARGIRASLIADMHTGSYKGFLFGGISAGVYNSEKSEKRGLEGLCVAGVFTNQDGSYLKGGSLSGFLNFSNELNGFAISGAMNSIDENVKGFLLSGVYNTARDMKGGTVSGVTNYIKGKLNGVSYATIYNHADENGKIAIQIGLINNIRRYNSESFVLQIGLYNRAGEQTIPLINIRGLRKLKKTKSKK